MPLSSPQAVLRYYQAVWVQVRRHAGIGPGGAAVLATDGREDDPGSGASASASELSDLSDPQAFLATAGGPWLGLSAHWPRRLVLRIRPGAGADVATAATAALDLAEQMSADGLVPVAFSDGVGGLAVMAAASGDIPATALRYAYGLAERAPELATLDTGQADGRCVVLIGWGGRSHPDHRPGPSPVPYSLVWSSDGPSPVVPLHLDEIAAIAAGMPLELEPEAVPQRVATRGDLASALLGEPTA